MRVLYMITVLVICLFVVVGCATQPPQQKSTSTPVATPAQEAEQEPVPPSVDDLVGKWEMNYRFKDPDARGIVTYKIGKDDVGHFMVEEYKRVQTPLGQPNAPMSTQTEYTNKVMDERGGELFWNTSIYTIDSLDKDTMLVYSDMGGGAKSSDVDRFHRVE